MNVRSIEKRSQIPQQADSPDRAPADVLDQTVAGRGLRRNPHIASSVLAVVEAEKETAPVVELEVAIRKHREGSAPQPREAQHHPDQGSQFPNGLETAVVRRRH